MNDKFFRLLLALIIAAFPIAIMFATFISMRQHSQKAELYRECLAQSERSQMNLFCSAP